MNLHELAIKNGANKIWPLTADYLEAYELHFSRFAGKKINMLEIGIESGGSLKMWYDYFPEASISGIDINPECSKFKNDRISVAIGNQGHKEFMEGFVKNKLFDIIIDDGSHQVKHQVNCFTWLWHTVNPGGFYVIEDLHTSYWPRWGGEYKGKDTTIEYIKYMIDNINHKAISHEKAGTRKANIRPMRIRSLHVYSGICFIEKE